MIRWNNKGYSLLEIMVAVAILATAFTILLAGQSQSLLSSSKAEDLTTATFLARQKMAELEIEIHQDLERNKFPHNDVEKEGEFEEPYEDFRWRYTIKKVEIPVVSTGDESSNALVGSYMKNVMDQISKQIREIDLYVYWGDRDLPEEKQKQMRVTTHIVRL